MKKTTLLKSMLLLCALIVGSSAWATDVVFTFNTDAGLSELGITKPNPSNGTNLATTAYTLSGVSMTASHGSTETRVWNSSGTLELRIYKSGGSLKFDAPGTITGIELTGSAVGNFSVTNGTFSAGSWTKDDENPVTSVTLTATNTGKINTITVTYSASSKVATPTFDPAAGAVASGTEVTISCGTAGATIYYTTDGSTPTTSSTAYNPSSKPSITAATTIKAFAVKDGLTDSDVASASYTIATPCATPTFSVAEGEVDKGTSVTISCATDGATIYYTTNGSTPTTSSTEYTDAITVNSAMTIKAIAVKDGMANSAVASASYTVRDYATLPFTWAGGTSDELKANSGVTGTNLGSDYASSHGAYRVKFGSAGSRITIKTNSQPGKVVFNVKLASGALSTTTISVKSSANGTDWTNLESVTIKGSQNDILSFETTKAFAATDRYVQLYYNREEDTNLGVGPIKITGCEAISTAATKTYATYVTTNALDFSIVSSDIKAYVAASTASEGSITFTGKDAVPAGTPLLIKTTSAGATVNVPVAASAPAAIATNYLVAGTGSNVTYDAGAGHYYYILTSGEFKQANNSPVAVGKAYLALPSAATSNELTINFDDEAGDVTGIATVSSKRQNNGEYYNLNGQRVDASHKGIVIVNGKKFFNK